LGGTGVCCAALCYYSDMYVPSCCSLGLKWLKDEEHLVLRLRVHESLDPLPQYTLLTGKSGQSIFTFVLNMCLIKQNIYGRFI